MKSEVYNCDCMELMARYPDKYFDLAIVDPPYGIGDTFIYGSSGAIKGKLNRTHKKIDWDDNIPTPEYFKELKRVSQNQIIWGANYFNSFDRSGGALVWYKNRGANTLSQCEIASVSGQKKVDYLSLQVLTGFVADEERIHPTQKPVKLYKWILENYAVCKKCHNTGVIHENVGESWMGPQDMACEWCDVSLVGPPKILDTHLGSGSSRIAAEIMGFDFVGAEIDVEYYNAQEKRFALHMSQPRLNFNAA